MYYENPPLNELTHFGVIGMKWGKRNNKPSVNSETSWNKEAEKSKKYSKAGFSPTYNQAWRDSLKGSDLKTKLRRSLLFSTTKEIETANKIYEGRVAAKEEFKAKTKALEEKFSKRYKKMGDDESMDNYFSDLKAEKEKLKKQYAKNVANVILKNL